MSDPMANVEIQDVLSSIRRLVSEDRRAMRSELKTTSPYPEAPVRNKLVLTSEQRIDEAAAPETDPARLEETIAELEAAVAGIGEDFEPDGSEVTPRTDEALDGAFAGGFHVDDWLEERAGTAAGDAGEEAASENPETGVAASEVSASDAPVARSGGDVILLRAKPAAPEAEPEGAELAAAGDGERAASVEDIVAEELVEAALSDDGTQEDEADDRVGQAAMTPDDAHAAAGTGRAETEDAQTRGDGSEETRDSTPWTRAVPTA